MLATLLSIIAALEVARRLPLLLTFRKLASISGRTPRIWAYRLGLEERKERATRLLAVRMFGHSISAMVMLALIISPIGLIIWVDPLLGFDARETLMNWKDRLVVAVLSLVYALSRDQIARRLQRP